MSVSVLEMKVGRMVRGCLRSNVLHGVTKILSTPPQEFARHRLANLQIVIFQTVSEKFAATDQPIPRPCPMDTD